MKSRRQRGLLILIAIFVGLAAAVLLSNNRPPLDAIEIVLTRIYPAYTDLDVSAIRLRSPLFGTETTFARTTNGTWNVLSSPTPLDPQTAVNIARTVVLLAYERTFPRPSSGDLSAYGFAPNGVLYVEFITTDGTSHSIGVGGLDPLGTVYYAVADTHAGILALNRAAVDYLLVTARQFASR
jgi:hypothetical protein